MPHDEVGKTRLSRPAVVWSLAASCLIFFAPAAVDADETRWRLTKADTGELMLVMAGNDDAIDAIGSYFLCKAGTGLMTVEGNMQDGAVRRAIAGLILNAGYPSVELVPGPERSVIDQITSADDGSWRYRFQTNGDTAAFHMFKETGYFEFKIGNAVVRAGVKAGLGKIAEFRAACWRPVFPNISSGSKVQK